MTMIAIAFAFVSAMFYVSATLIMKLYGASAFVFALPAACLAMGIAAAFEIEILKDSNMARVFVVILGFEILATMICAVLLTDDSVGWRDGLGALLLLAGVLVMSAGPVEISDDEIARQTRIASR